MIIVPMNMQFVKKITYLLSIDQSEKYDNVGHFVQTWPDSELLSHSAVLRL